MALSVYLNSVQHLNVYNFTPILHHYFEVCQVDENQMLYKDNYVIIKNCSEIDWYSATYC